MAAVSGRMLLCIIAVLAASAAVDAAPTLEFRDSEDPSDAGVTLIHDPADPEAANALVCSGEFQAADVRINGTNTTMAQIIQKVGTLESEARELTQRLDVLASIESDVQMLKLHFGMMPPPTSPPCSPCCCNLATERHFFFLLVSFLYYTERHRKHGIPKSRRKEMSRPA